MNLIEECIKKGYTFNEKNEIMNKKGKVLSLYLNKEGYPCFTAHFGSRKDGTRKARRVFVHRLKAYLR